MLQQRPETGRAMWAELTEDGCAIAVCAMVMGIYVLFQALLALPDEPRRAVPRLAAGARASGLAATPPGRSEQLLGYRLSGRPARTGLVGVSGFFVLSLSLF